jgi:hypothetical protein
MKRLVFWLLSTLLALALVADAQAVRRTLRVEFGDWSDAGVCAGSGVERSGVLLLWDGKLFSGLEDDRYLFDTYCQTTINDAFSEFSFFGEEGLAQLVGPNTDNAITGVRWSLLDRDRFDAQFDNEGGFQWAFYFFPDEITIVALYGLIENGQPIPLSDSSYIRDTQAFYWQGGEDGFDGEYFCFVAGEYVGTWDGEPVGNDPLDACLPARPIFNDRFEVLAP